jgi:hypothetical protein
MNIFRKIIICLSLLVLFSADLFSQSNNDKYIQYFNENNIEYIFDADGNIVFGNRYRIITNTGIFGITEISSRPENHFQILIVAKIELRIDQEWFTRLNILINWVNSQTVMAKIFLSENTNADESYLFVSSEIILKDTNDFVYYIDIMCDAIETTANLWQDNIHRMF